MFHEINSLAGHLVENVSNVLPAFDILTGSEYTTTFFTRNKFTRFKRMITHWETCNYLEKLSDPSVNIAEVTEFVLWVIYGLEKKRP